jgi:hypothetical protein
MPFPVLAGSDQKVSQHASPFFHVAGSNYFHADHVYCGVGGALDSASVDVNVSGLLVGRASTVV